MKRVVVVVNEKWEIVPILAVLRDRYRLILSFVPQSLFRLPKHNSQP